MDWWIIFLTLGLAQACFLIIVLLSIGKSNTEANRYMAFLVMAVLLLIGYELGESFHLSYVNTVLKILSISSALLIGPCLFLYFKTLLQPLVAYRVKPIFHFIPYSFLLAILTTIEMGFSGITDLPDEFLPGYILPIEALKLTHLIAYLYASYHLVSRYARNQAGIRLQRRAKYPLMWFRALLLIFSGILVLSLFYFIFIKFLDVELPIGGPRSIAAVFVALIYLIAFVAIRFPILISVNDQEVIIYRLEKYKTSPLDKEGIRKCKEKLIHFMEDQKPYLDEKLKIETLAQAVDIPKHYLSQIINQEFEKSFQEFVNHYRVQEFKKRITDPRSSQKTILAIAYESGFNSKASFNRIFKSLMSMTPNEYKKKNDTYK